MRLPVLAAIIAVLPFSAALAQTPAAPVSPMPTQSAPDAGKLPPGHPPMGAMQAPAGKVEMSHSGTVEETLAASPYVYVHVKTADGDQWLAAPAIELKKGAAIRWPEGMVMKNWHSKTLNRSFDTVYFVSAVEPAPGK